VISTDGLDDLWANPIGTEGVYLASNSIYKFLNCSARNAIHFREGGHGYLMSDFNTLLNFTDKMLFGKEV